MTNKQKYILAGIGVLIVFAAGRYSVPLSVKTESKKSDTEDKKVSDQQDTKKNSHKQTTTTVITRPDGTKEEKTVVTDDESSLTNKKDTSDQLSKKTDDEKKEVTRSSSRLTVSALAGTKLSFSAESFVPDYGISVTHDLIGPINMGLFGFKSGFAGISLGLSF